MVDEEKLTGAGIFGEGVRAFQAGLHLVDNPYRSDRWAYRARDWRKGWLYAKKHTRYDKQLKKG